MGQPKKVCITTPQKRTYGSLKVKWDNRKKLLLLLLLFYKYKKLKKSRFSGDHFPEKSMYNDTAKTERMEAQKQNGTNEKSMYNDTAKKNVWKPKSKMGQPKKYV